MFTQLNQTQSEPRRFSHFLCLRMQERLQRGSRPEELKTSAEEAASAARHAVALEEVR